MSASMLTAAVPATDDGCDSYDADLGWIVEKLCDRASGSFGLILRFVEDRLQPAWMAKTVAAASLTAAELDLIAVHLQHDIHNRPSGDSAVLHESHAFFCESLGVGKVRLLYMVFRPAPGVHIVAAVCRDDASFNLLQGFVAKRLHPVLARYIHLWWLHRTERRRADALQTAFELADIGMTLLDRQRRIVSVNAYVRRLLESGDGLRQQGTSLVASDPVDQSKLHAAVQQAVLANALMSEEGVGEWRSPMVVLRRARAQRSLLVTVLPHQRRAIDPGDATSILYVLDPERDVRKLLGPVFQVYGLTAAESRLTLQLVNGSSVTQAAALLHVGVPTARTYLKQVFEKTRTNRQAELVRVMLASALRNSVGVDLISP